MKKTFYFIGGYTLLFGLNLYLFYVTGMYSFTTPPTRLVLFRLLVFPIIYEAIIIFIWWMYKLIKKHFKNNKKSNETE